MTMGTADAEVGQLSLPQELVLMLLNEEGIIWYTCRR